MDVGSALAAALVVLVLASFPAVIWFFYFRRAMIRRIASVARSLEAAVRPRDKRYWHLGYLVGFKARYWVNRGPVKAVNALYVIPPYHVFFYLPIVVLGGRRERLDIAVELRDRVSLDGEAHVVNARDRYATSTFKRDAGDPGRLERSKIVINSSEFELYHSGGRAGDVAKALARRLSEASRLLRVTVDGGRRVLYASVNPNPGEPVDGIVEAVMRAAEELGRGP